MFDKIIKPGIVLFAISVCAASILGFAYSVTKEPIEIRAEQAKNDSMNAILPDAVFEDLELSSETVSSVFSAKIDGEIIGYIIFTNPDGFDNTIELITGITTDGEIKGVRIANMTETPGLGANAEKPAFIDQYIGKKEPISVTKIAPPEDNEIVAITSATITSNAVTKGVNDALEFYNTEIKEVQ